MLSCTSCGKPTRVGARLPSRRHQRTVLQEVQRRLVGTDRAGRSLSARQAKVKSAIDKQVEFRANGQEREKSRREAARRPSGPPPTPRLQERYEKEVCPAWRKKLGRNNPHVAAAARKDRGQHGRRQRGDRKEAMEDAVAAMTQITGQKPLVTKARKAIAGFRLREGMQIGCKVTLARAADVRVPGSA